MKTPLKQLQQKTALMIRIDGLLKSRCRDDRYQNILMDRWHRLREMEIPGLSEIERILTPDQLLKLSTAPDDEIRITWTIDDIHEVRPELTNAQCRKVLYALKRNHDSTIGINWDVIASQAESLFGYPPEDLADEDHHFELQDRVIMPEPDREQGDTHEAAQMAIVVGLNYNYHGRGVNCHVPANDQIYSIDGRRLRLMDHPVEIDRDSGNRFMDIFQ